MKTPDFWYELVRRNRPLALSGLVFLALAVISLLLAGGPTVNGTAKSGHSGGSPPTDQTASCRRRSGEGTNRP